MQNQTFSVPNFLFLVSQITSPEEVIKIQCKIIEVLYRENSSIKEENYCLKQKNESLNSQLEDALCMAIWNQEAGEITSPADWLNKRDDDESY